MWRCWIPFPGQQVHSLASSPHGLHHHQSETNPIQHFPELGVSSMIHSHALSSSCPRADHSWWKNKRQSISENSSSDLCLLLDCLTRVQTLPYSLPGLDDKHHLANGSNNVLPRGFLLMPFAVLGVAVKMHARICCWRVYTECWIQWLAGCDMGAWPVLPLGNQWMRILRDTKIVYVLSNLVKCTFW